MKTKLYLLAVLLLAMMAVFTLHASDLQRPLWQDDLGLVPAVARLGLLDVHELLSPYWGLFYRPTFFVYLWALTHITGGNPVALHAGSLFLHAVNIVLLYWLVFRVSKNHFLAAGAAALFLFWPGKAQAIWWVSSASTLLALGFSLATLHLWLSYRLTESRRWYVMALTCFLLALCSKEDAASLPFILLTFELTVCPVNSWAKRLRYCVPFAVVVVAYFAMDVIAYKTFSAHEARSNLYSSPLQRGGHLFDYLDNLLTVKLGTSALVPVHRLLPLCALAAMGIVLWQYRAGRGAWLCLVLAALPLPLASGIHAVAQERFYYVAAGYAAIATAALIAALWYRKQREGAIVLMVALTVAYAPYIGSFLRSDPDTTWPVLFFTVAALCVAWRAGVIDWTAPALALVIGLSTQLYLEGPAQIGAVFLCGAIAYRWKFWPGALAALLFWANPGVTLLLFAVAVIASRVSYPRKTDTSLVHENVSRAYAS